MRTVTITITEDGEGLRMSAPRSLGELDLQWLIAMMRDAHADVSRGQDTCITVAERGKSVEPRGMNITDCGRACHSFRRGSPGDPETDHRPRSPAVRLDPETEHGASIRMVYDRSLLRSLRLPDRPGGRGPFIGRGTCLEPHVHSGDRIYIEPGAPAHDGDLVVVSTDDATYYGIVLASREGLEQLRDYGTAPRLLVKRLVVRGGRRFLASNTGMFPVGGSFIIGPVTRVERGAESGA